MRKKYAFTTSMSSQIFFVSLKSSFRYIICKVNKQLFHHSQAPSNYCKKIAYT